MSQLGEPDIIASLSPRTAFKKSEELLGRAQKHAFGEKSQIESQALIREVTRTQLWMEKRLGEIEDKLGRLERGWRVALGEDDGDQD